MIEDEEALDLIFDKDEDEDEDIPSVIPRSKYKAEQEEKVKFYMSSVKNVLADIGMKPFRINETKYTRVKTPSFKDKKSKLVWEETEIERCINGYKGMSGKMYFYFNYGWIKNLSRGKFPPEYRVCDDEWYSMITETQKKTGYGIVCIKRRRVGASWKEAADTLHDSLFTPFFVTGMNSKSVVDSQILFNKVKFMFDNLPEFLKIKVRSKTKMFYDFSYEIDDSLGNKVKKGTQSEIIVTAPTESAFEGHMLNKWVCDEAGKQEGLPQMWSFTEDCMMEETRRLGMPILFGTSGDIGKTGKGLKEMWTNSKIYRLRRFFFVGYMGLLVDDKGNDNIEDAIRWIVYERKRRQGLSSKQYHDFLQRYPLTVKEAFAQTSEGGIGDIVKIQMQKDALEATPPKATRGRFKINRIGEIEFYPDPNGDAVVYENAKKSMSDLYVAGCDPADHDIEDRTNLSNLSLYILSKRNGITPPKVAAQLTCRPKMLNDYYQQAIMMLQYYNNTRVLIEKNRARMIAYFDDSGFKHLLHYAPQGIVKLVGGTSHTIGVTMTKAMKEYLGDLCVEYIDENYQWIPDTDLLDEFMVWGVENTDRVIAFGLALMLLKEDKAAPEKRGQYDISVPRFGFKKDARGNIVRC